MPALPLPSVPEPDTGDRRLVTAKRADAPARDFQPSAPGDVARKPVSETHPVESAPDAELIRSDEDLVVRLCRMPVDLAAPLLRASLPTLTPQALLALIAATGEAHQCLVAARPHLDWRVIKALFRTRNDRVLAAMARNPALAFDDEDEALFARHAVENADLRDAILNHAGLRIAKAQVRLHRGEDRGHGNLKLLALVRGGETAAFVREMARRLKLDTARLSQALTATSPVALALTLCAAGLDRAVFLHVVRAWQASNDGRPYMAEGQKPLVLSIFNFPAAEARRRLAMLIDTAH